MEDDPAYDIVIVPNGETDQDPLVAGSPIREVVLAALRRHRVQTARINVALVNDAQIAELNRKHLNHAGPTDVLTFDLRDAGPEDPASGEASHSKALEADIVISVQTAESEASSRGHSIEAEVSLYAVHGVLHLLGYDDRREEEAARMHAVEDEILVSLGMGAVFRTEPR